MRVLVTGGCGFIGSAVVRHLIAHTDAHVLNVDKLTYAATPEAIGSGASDARYRFVQADVCDALQLDTLLASFRPTHVMHLAAESHVDRSIDGPAAFIQTNIIGTYILLQAVLRYFETLSKSERKGFLFHHISTDEVFGSLGADGAFSETSPYDPHSPYSASKASSDHLVRAWYHTYGLPTLVTNCSNNYGPYQFPEKLIPLAILKAIVGERIPVYGKGDNVRDWLYVDDHARALVTIITQGKAGDTFNVGGRSERENLEVIRTLCCILDKELPSSPHRPHFDLVTFVADRPGHDQRYAIDPGKLERELGFFPSVSFEEGLRRTINWYLENEAWWRPLLTQRYQGQRLGTAKSR